MGARRFYLPSALTSPVSPSFDAGWEQTGQAVRRRMFPKLKLSASEALTVSTSVTVPITTTQDILCAQFISDPLRAQRVLGTMSLVLGKLFENANSNNVTLAVVLKGVQQDGTLISTLFSNFNQDTEFPLTANSATRIVNAQALTPTTMPEGWRLVLEVGGHATSPTAAGSFTMKFGSPAGTADFALTSGLTTDLIPWLELSEDVLPAMPNNYQFVRADSGMSVSEKIR